jgi:hypothetical protein
LDDGLHVEPLVSEATSPWSDLRTSTRSRYFADRVAPQAAISLTG